MWHSTSGVTTHFIFETLAYLVGARIFWSASRGQAQPAPIDRLLLLGAAVFGAFIGSKFLHAAEHLPYFLARDDPVLWLSGKSVLGGFIGGTLTSEVAKRYIGWREPTGDAWVAALAVGLMIGRVGCQLSGVWDQTYGIATRLPWGCDYGDGIARHPTGLYEIVLVAAAFALTRWRGLRIHKGAAFAAFLLAYCAIRLGLDFLKPPFGPTAPGSLPVAMYAGLSAIQWAALVGMAWYCVLLRKRMRAVERKFDPSPSGRRE